jgi:coatomer protein complex subunit gamma
MFYFFDIVKVIIVTSSLMKDMNSKIDMYRANAIRVLCRITDGTLLAQIERYLKQAIVDKNPVVASAALVSGIHLLQVIAISICNSVYFAHPMYATCLFCAPSLQTNPEIVKRWSNEVQEAVQSRAALVQFHALGLLHQVCRKFGYFVILDHSVNYGSLAGV